MDQYIDSRHKEIFWNLLAEPADNGASYVQTLERLVNDNPQSNILQVMLARANGYNNLSRAATYFNPYVLHKLVNDPGSFATVNKDDIIPGGQEDGGIIASGTSSTESLVAEPLTEEAVGFNNSSPVLQTTGEVSADFDSNTDVEDVAERSISKEDTETATSLPVENLPEIPQPATHLIDEEPIEEITEAPLIYNGNLEIQVIDDTKELQFEEAELPVSDSDLPDASAKVNRNADGTITQAAPKHTTNNEDQVQEDTIKSAEAWQPTQDTGYRSFGSRFPKPEQRATEEPEQHANAIEDEIYDEIVGIEDIGFSAISESKDTHQQTETEHRFSEPAHEEEESEPSEMQFHQPETPIDQHISEVQEEEEKLILGGIAGGDYRAFDKKLDELRSTNPSGQQEAEKAKEPLQANEDALPNEKPAHEAATSTSLATDANHVSRYDDDTLPYTFLWWLNKTRREYAGNTQPYAKAAAQAGVSKRPDELQQQYFENIFTLTSVNAIEHIDAVAPVEFDHTKKEDVIIERFIQTDPQIKPLSADKLDNENKARKSAEDQHELVTETLARIYTDQMLYHKAIATYKKLMLKIPDKKTYFAGRIEELEKKTN
ncbi:hypothetical protein ACFQZX_13135 [Mucilaginibacter litoreus]|uniref:Uncharacterized protein n=1 Tax=Mucilaginibacter litoreus TaxID=1048221 RepID=A0ABW3AW26_9SPHI